MFDQIRRVVCSFVKKEDVTAAILIRSEEIWKLTTEILLNHRDYWSVIDIKRPWLSSKRYNFCDKNIQSDEKPLISIMISVFGAQYKIDSLCEEQTQRFFTISNLSYVSLHFET